MDLVIANDDSSRWATTTLDPLLLCFLILMLLSLTGIQREYSWSNGYGTALGEQSLWALLLCFYARKATKVYQEVLQWC